MAPARILALHQALEARGLDAAQAGRLMYDVYASFFRSLPPLVARTVRAMSFSRLTAAVMRAYASRSQKRRYPGDFVFEFVEGDGTSFEGLDFVAVPQHLQDGDANQDAVALPR